MIKDNSSPAEKKSENKAFSHQLTGRFDFLAEIVDEEVRQLLLASKAYTGLSICDVNILDDGNLLIKYEFGRYASAGEFVAPDKVND